MTDCGESVLLAMELDKTLILADFEEWEVAGMTWQNINIEKQYLTVRRNVRYNGATHKHEVLEVKMIRRMTIDDYEKIFDLWKSTGGMGLRSLDDSQQGIFAFLKRNPTTNFVAVDNGEITGTILCGHDGRRGYIYHTVVKKNYRNQGIGTKLIEAAVFELQKEGITRVCLNVMETNEYGKSFWQKRGWEKKDFLGFYSKSVTDKENIPLSDIS